jgi:hypothetical protein
MLVLFACRQRQHLIIVKEKPHTYQTGHLTANSPPTVAPKNGAKVAELIRGSGTPPAAFGTLVSSIRVMANAAYVWTT